MPRRLVRTGALVALLLVAGPRAGASEEHSALLTMRTLVGGVQQNSAQMIENPDRREELIAQNFDLIAASVHWDSFFKLVFGREWLSLNEEQQQSLGEKLKQLIARAYVRALDQFVDYRIEYLRVQESPRPDIVAVEMKVYPPDESPPLEVQSRMRRIGDRWLNFDFLTGGISISSAYKSNYRKLLGEKGYDGLIVILDEAIARHQRAQTDDELAAPESGSESGGGSSENTSSDREPETDASGARPGIYPAQRGGSLATGSVTFPLRLSSLWAVTAVALS